MKVEFISGGGSGGGGTSITLTTTGTSGASTLSGGGVLNIPVYADNNTNLGDTNLTQSDTTRTFNVASGGVLKINDNGGNTIATFNDTNNVMNIGDTSPYAMPNNRGTIGELLRQSDSLGQVSFQTLTSTIECPQQIPAGQGYQAFAFASAELYVPNQKGQFTNIGTTSDTTISNTIIGALGNPFRHFSDTNIRIATGSDFINIKFTSQFATLFTFYVIMVDLADGQAVASAPMSAKQIGTIGFGGKYPNAVDTWVCEEWDISGLGIEASGCRIFYVGFSLLASFPEPYSLNMIATYNQPTEITNTFV